MYAFRPLYVKSGVKYALVPVQMRGTLSQSGKERYLNTGASRDPVHSSPYRSRSILRESPSHPSFFMRFHALNLSVRRYVT